jgi:hypothetical protein
MRSAAGARESAGRPLQRNGGVPRSGVIVREEASGTTPAPDDVGRPCGV